LDEILTGGRMSVETGDWMGDWMGDWTGDWMEDSMRV